MKNTHREVGVGSNEERIEAPSAGAAEAHYQEHHEIEDLRKVQRVTNHIEAVDGLVHANSLLAFAPNGDRKDCHHAERSELSQEAHCDGNAAQELDPGHEPLIEPDEGNLAVLQRVHECPVPDLVEDLEVPAHDEENTYRNAVDEESDIGLGNSKDYVLQQVHLDSFCEKN